MTTTHTNLVVVVTVQCAHTCILECQNSNIFYTMISTYYVTRYVPTHISSGGGVVTEQCAQFLSKKIRGSKKISIYAKIVGCRNFSYAYTLLIYTTTYLQPSAMCSSAPKYAGCQSFPYTLIYRTCIDI